MNINYFSKLQNLKCFVVFAKQSKVLIVLSFLSLIATSCNEDNIYVKENNKVKDSNTKNLRYSSDINDTAGKIELVGRLHNEALDHIATLNNFPELSFEELFSETCFFVENKTNTPYRLTLIETSSMINEYCGLDLSEACAILYSKNYINKNQKRLFDILKNIIENIGDTTHFIAKLNSFENSIKLRNDVSNSEKEPLLLASVMARYSFTYWDNVSKDRNSKWYSIVNGPESSDRKCWVADIIGAILGFGWGGGDGHDMEGAVGGAIGAGLLASASCLFGQELAPIPIK